MTAPRLTVRVYTETSAADEIDAVAAVARGGLPRPGRDRAPPRPSVARQPALGERNGREGYGPRAMGREVKASQLTFEQGRAAICPAGHGETNGRDCRNPLVSVLISWA
jgi:hypothetical protein